jgi:transmembrane sensor
MGSPARPSWIRASFRVATLVAMFALLCLDAWGGEELPAPQVYSTGIGELRRVVLGQHAVANLNTRTVVSVSLAPHACEIELKSGEALFEIRRNDARKVHLTAGSMRMEADAAAFSVRLRDADRVDVLVRKGRVMLTNASEAVTLTANHMAYVSSHGVRLERFDGAEMQRRFQWTTGYLSFGGETLEEVAEEFNRYNPQQLVIEDSSIRRLRIGGNYQSTDPEGFVAALRPMGVQRMEPASGDASAIRLIGARGH